MARCAMCDKGAQFGKAVSHSRSHVSGRSNKMWKSNIRSVKMDIDGTSKKIYLCAQCLRTLRKPTIAE